MPTRNIEPALSCFSVRPKALAAAVALAIATGFGGSANAAGLGRLTVQSGLGQPLRAEVEIAALGADEAASMTARIASPDAFRQAGLQYNPVVTTMRVEIVRRTDGRPVITITSGRPVNEAFMDLLVELNWASGRLMREYTFLLDPPEMRLNAQTANSGTAQANPVAAPVAAVSAPVAPARPAAPVKAVPAPAKPAVVAAAPAVGVKAQPSKPARVGTPTEVTINRGDTLTAIAGSVRPAAATLEQTMIALYRANPAAFFGSPHQMYSGRTLTVPDPATTLAIDPATARQELRESAVEFQAYRMRLADAAREIPATKAGQAAVGAIGPKAPDRASTVPGDQLKLSKQGVSGAATRGAAGASATGGGKGAAGAAAGVADAESQVANGAALREMQSRMSDLERNVADLQKLLELKNRQLADLERQLSESRMSSRPVAGAVTAAPETAKEAAAPAPVAAAPAPAAPPAEAPAAAPAPAPEATKPAAPAAKPVAPTPEGQGFFDDLAANPVLLPGLGGLALLGGFYAWYLRRRRKSVERFEDSLVATDAFTANSLFGATGGQSVDTGESLFASSTKNSGLEVHSTEVDPIAEAEVYIAYGREAQAEEILREALARQPERQAIRLKLCEVLAGRSDVGGFGALAQEMFTMGGGQNEEWAKVVMLGLSIDPDNPLYTGQAPVNGPDSQIGSPTEIGPSDDEEAAPGDNRPEISGSTFANLDFELDTATDSTVVRAEKQRTAVSPPAGEQDSALEQALEGRIDLPSLNIADAAQAEGARAGSGRTQDRGAKLPKAAARAEPDAIADLHEYDVDIPSFDTLSGPMEPEPGLVDLSSIGLDLNPDTISRSTDGDAERWQEMATKLDLAGAYEEIGDKEGARELLEEVIAGGDSAQQEQARALLAKIR